MKKKSSKNKPAAKELKPKHPGGRPTKYTPQLASLICERVATTTFGLAKLCELHNDLPDKTTVNLWRYKYPEFSTQYAQAKLKQADLLAEECLEIADNATQDVKLNDDGYETFNAEFVARSRLKIDTRKWLASKLLPKQYGLKLMLDQKNDENEQLKEELQLLRAKLNAENLRDY